MKATVAALVLVAAVALSGCGDANEPSTDGPATSPTFGTTAPADEQGVQELEDIVNGLDGVVGSAEAETAND